MNTSNTTIVAVSVSVILGSLYLFYVFLPKRDDESLLNRKKPSNGGEKKPSYFEVEDIDNNNNKEGDLASCSRTAFTSLGLEQPLVIAMVGLPARGKSYIVKMLKRFLSWSGYQVEIFNVGSYRRTVGFASASSAFFDNDEESSRFREELADAVQQKMYAWLNESGRRVAIFDATNTTRARRERLAKKVRLEKERT